ncbi:MAG TPA: hypothetical protein VJR29_02135 [bacterium]|nr:hypothetical protein [bacterium]
MVGACVLLCLFFLLRLGWLLFLGEGIPSDDSLLNALLIGRMLDGGYPWGRLFRDAYTNGHLNLFPILLQYLWAWLTGWNFRLALFVGVGLGLAKIFLLHSALARPREAWISWLLWTFLFGLTFAVTMMDVFQLDSSAFQLGLNQLGLVIGILALVRFPDGAKGALGASLGGWLATWSWGSGAATWPAFLLGMALLRFRKPAHYLMVAAAAVLSLLPYGILLLVVPKSGQEPKLLTFFNFNLVLQSLGLPFAQSYDPQMAWWSGLAGLLLGAAGLAACLRHRIDSRRLAAPLMLLLYVLLHLYQVSLFRSRLMPWYAYQAGLYWIGLLGLAYQLLLEKKSRWWPCLVTSTVVLLYLGSNWTWEDKVASLRHQGPASASCLWHYPSAPEATCENLLFRWRPYENFREMAVALARHRLALFGDRRSWSLQGDMITGGVVAQIPAGSRLRWIHGGRDLDYSDFRRLDLEIPPGGKVEWTVDLPSELRRAELSYERWTSGGAWEKFRSDLSAEAGKTAKIELGPGLYRYPSILLER